MEKTLEEEQQLAQEKLKDDDDMVDDDEDDWMKADYVSANKVQSPERTDVPITPPHNLSQDKAYPSPQHVQSQPTMGGYAQ